MVYVMVWVVASNPLGVNIFPLIPVPLNVPPAGFAESVIVEPFSQIELSPKIVILGSACMRKSAVSLGPSHACAASYTTMRYVYNPAVVSGDINVVPVSYSVGE